MIPGTEQKQIQNLPPPANSSGAAFRNLPPAPYASSASASGADPATIGKSLKIKGEVIGSESLFIDGNVEGAISLPNCRVTIARDAEVWANITAREVVVFGKVSGNIDASDRVDIRSEGSLTGDVTTRRITIGDGAMFHGGIAIRR